MKETECLGLPYPECNPPLVKDASDIEQFRDLAEAVDAEVQELDDALTATLFEPAAVKMSGGQNIAGTDITHFPAVVVFDNAGMANTTLDGISIQTDGWYMIGGWVRRDGGPTVTDIRVEPLLNGDPFTSRQGPGYSTPSTEDVTWTDVGFFRAGDFLNFMTHHTGNPATVFTYVHQMWALQVLTNV